VTEQSKKRSRRSAGEGTVYWDERRQRWVATRIVGYDDRGREIRKTGSGVSRSAAMERLRQRIREHERGLSSEALKTTVGDAVRDWLAYGQGQVDRQTVKTRTYLSLRVVDGLGDILLIRLTAKHVEKFLLSLAPTHSTRTLADTKAVLNGAIRRAVARDLVTRNVVELAVTPRGTAGRKSKSLTEKQALDVLTLTKGHWMYPYIAVSMLVGIRTEEMRALTWDHVYLDSTPPVIEVWRSVRRSGDTKTKKSRRTLAIPDVAVQALHRRRHEQDADRAKAGSDWEETGLVFTTSLGTGLDAANVRRAFRSALKQVPSVDPKDWTPRELRHSFVSLMSAGGAAVEQIAHVVGHSDTSTTERIYRHELRPVIRDGATFMNQFASSDDVGPDWHMEPLFAMPGEQKRSSDQSSKPAEGT